MFVDRMKPDRVVLSAPLLPSARVDQTAAVQKRRRPRIFEDTNLGPLALLLWGG